MIMMMILVLQQVENVIYTLNVQFSELKTIVEAHTGFIKALRTKNEEFRIGKTIYLSDEEEKELKGIFLIASISKGKATLESIGLQGL